MIVEADLNKEGHISIVIAPVVVDFFTDEEREEHNRAVSGETTQPTAQNEEKEYDYTNGTYMIGYAVQNNDKVEAVPFNIIPYYEGKFAGEKIEIDNYNPDESTRNFFNLVYDPQCQEIIIYTFPPMASTDLWATQQVEWKMKIMTLEDILNFVLYYPFNRDMISFEQDVYEVEKEVKEYTIKFSQEKYLLLAMWLQRFMLNSYQIDWKSFFLSRFLSFTPFNVKPSYVPFIDILPYMLKNLPFEIVWIEPPEGREREEITKVKVIKLNTDQYNWNDIGLKSMVEWNEDVNVVLLNDYVIEVLINKDKDFNTPILEISDPYAANQYDLYNMVTRSTAFDILPTGSPLDSFELIFRPFIFDYKTTQEAKTLLYIPTPIYNTIAKINLFDYTGYYGIVPYNLLWSVPSVRLIFDYQAIEGEEIEVGEDTRMLFDFIDPAKCDDKARIYAWNGAIVSDSGKIYRPHLDVDGEGGMVEMEKQIMTIVKRNYYIISGW